MACAVNDSEMETAYFSASSEQYTGHQHNSSGFISVEQRCSEEDERDAPYGLSISGDDQVGTKCDEIYWRLRQEELNQVPYDDEATYLQHRRILVDWMCEVGEDCHFDHCTLHTAVFYIDKLLQRYTMPKHHLQLLGLCCLNIAAKYEEAEERVPPVQQLNEIAKTSFSRGLVNQMEIMVLNQLGWCLNAVTPAHFLGYMVGKGLLFKSDTMLGKKLIPKVPRYLQKYVKFFCDLCAQDHSFLQYKPSILAAAIAVASRRALTIMPMWNDNLDEVVHYREDEIRPVFLHVWLHYRENFSTECSQADERYQDDVTAKADAHMLKIATRSGKKRSPSGVTDM
eukprot:gb/GECG01016088.1/.p1 GENE.gb/GECG01016088.1/~~gb/GECG01016088.1/.p1  ORF type:complete len:340 (+),score=39.13 gb/GECG01016088.1/:1-1020(+)